MMNHRISVVITDTNLDYGDVKVQEDVLDLIREFQVNLVELCYFGVIAGPSQGLKIRGGL